MEFYFIFVKLMKREAFITEYSITDILQLIQRGFEFCTLRLQS